MQKARNRHIKRREGFTNKMHKVDDQNLVMPKAQRNRRVNIGGD
jgi:hypothetical protein